MIEPDAKRYAQIKLHPDDSPVATFAPSVADAWQNRGLGSKMFVLILDKLRTAKYKYVLMVRGSGLEQTSSSFLL
jgi:predicted N-acetyltransferase YhbS